MSKASVRISAPSRIHFGLLSLGQGSNLRYGGAGVMVEQPRVELCMERSDVTQVDGLHSQRVRDFIHAWRGRTGISADVRCHVLAAPREHVGLGLGTQLGLSVARALDSLFHRQDISIEERAESVGRGMRSAIGTHGFHSGGLIIERGKRRDESLGHISERIELPPAWKLLLICSQGQSGLAGMDEKQAFEKLPRVSNAHTECLRKQLFDVVIPAARDGKFDEFSESIYHYGTMAGECFAAQQGGPFASPAIAELVQWLRRAGVYGVGQSSWGPTVFCWFPGIAPAETFSDFFRTELPNLEATLIVTSVANHGALVEEDS